MASATLRCSKPSGHSGAVSPTSAGCRPYVVFSDATLLAMASTHPTTESQLLTVPGVGPVKLERYGKAFLEVLRAGE